MNHYVVEMYVDELEECLIMKCSNFEGASYICELLSEHFPNSSFDVSESRPNVHLKNYDPERYAEIRNLLISPKETQTPKLIVVQGGKG